MTPQQIAWMDFHWESINNALQGPTLDYGFLRALEDDPHYKIEFGSLRMDQAANLYTAHLQQLEEQPTAPPENEVNPSS